MRPTQKGFKWFPHSQQPSSSTRLPVSCSPNQLLVKTGPLKPAISCYFPFCVKIFTGLLFCSSVTPNSAFQNCCGAGSCKPPYQAFPSAIHALGMKFTSQGSTFLLLYNHELLVTSDFISKTFNSTFWIPPLCKTDISMILLFYVFWL